MINIGGNIEEVYVSSTKIAEAYVGNQLVYESSNEPVPYDAKIKYLQGDGNAYIKVPFSSKSTTTTFSLDFIPTILNYEASLLGSRTATNRRFCWIVITKSNQIQVGYGTYYENLNLAFVVGDVIRITTSISGSNITYTASNLTKGTSVSKSWTLSSFIVSSFIYLFWSSALQKSKHSVTKLWIADNDVKVVDCIPVRVGTYGYMYDKISGELFGNDGTGNFIIGT